MQRFALPLPCQTTQRQKGVGRHQAFVGIGCLFGMGTASHGSNVLGHQCVCGGPHNRLAPGEQAQHISGTFSAHENMRGACNRHKGTALAPCGQRLHPSVDRRAPVCWYNHGKHTGARRPTLGCKVSIRTTNVVPWWRACMRLASFRAERLCKVHVGVVRRAQVCCEDPHKQTSARVGTTRGGSHAKQTAIAY